MPQDEYTQALENGLALTDAECMDLSAAYVDCLGLSLMSSANTTERMSALNEDSPRSITEHDLTRSFSDRRAPLEVHAHGWLVKKATKDIFSRRWLSRYFVLHTAPKNTLLLRYYETEAAAVQDAARGKHKKLCGTLTLDQHTVIDRISAASPLMGGLDRGRGRGAYAWSISFVEPETGARREMICAAVDEEQRTRWAAAIDGCTELLKTTAKQHCEADEHEAADEALSERAARIASLPIDAERLPPRDDDVDGPEQPDMSARIGLTAVEAATTAVASPDCDLVDYSPDYEFSFEMTQWVLCPEDSAPSPTLVPAAVLQPPLLRPLSPLPRPPALLRPTDGSVSDSWPSDSGVGGSEPRTSIQKQQEGEDEARRSRILSRAAEGGQDAADGAASAQSPRPGGAAAGAVLLSGWLEKRGAVHTAWRSRHFVLRAPGGEGGAPFMELSYQRGEAPADASGDVISLEPGVRVAAADADRPHAFEVVTPARRYLLAAATADEAQAWVAALQVEAAVELKAGVLKRREGVALLAGWRPRYMVLLEHGELLCYEGASAASRGKCKGRFTLSAQTQLARLAGGATPRTPRPSRSSRGATPFALREPGGAEWLLDPGSLVGWDAWEDALLEAIEAKRVTHPFPTPPTVHPSAIEAKRGGPLSEGSKSESSSKRNSSTASSRSSGGSRKVSLTERTSLSGDI